jgi:hypothetical protein
VKKSSASRAVRGAKTQKVSDAKPPAIALAAFLLLLLTPMPRSDLQTTHINQQVWLQNA